MRVACLLHLHSAFCKVGAFMYCAAVGSRRFDRRLKTPFSSWLGYLPSFLCARPTHVFGTAFQGPMDTLADESFSPRQTDGELLVLMCLRQGTEEEGRKLGGEPAIRFSQLLELLGQDARRNTSTAWWRRRQAGFPSLCPRRTWPTCGTAYGSSSWRRDHLDGLCNC